MWRLPGAMRACPGRTRSPSVASRTRTGQSPLQRSAKACVNRSGMCWTMTSPGASGRIAMRNCWIASVPPVDAPTAITDAADGARRPVGASGSVRARAAAFTAPSISETTSGIRRTSSREGIRVRPLHGPEASAAPVPEPSHVDRAGVGVEVELPPELPTEVATDDGNVLASQELVDEPDVPLGDAVAVSTDLEDVAAAEDLRPGAAAIAARLLQRPHETVHRVHAESGVVEPVLSTRPRRREHEVVHSAHARDRIEETDGDTRAEERPDDRRLARRVPPAAVDCHLRPAAARPPPA